MVGGVEILLQWIPAFAGMTGDGAAEMTDALILGARGGSRARADSSPRKCARGFRMIRSGCQGRTVVDQAFKKSAEWLDLEMMLGYSLSMPINLVDKIDNWFGGMLS